ncbi:MAG: hypothetical protein ACOH5I_00910 [Oligoflexus sp.]
MAKSNFSEYFYERLEFWGERALDAVTPGIFFFEGMDKARIHYQFFLVVGLLTVFALFVIYIVDHRMIRAQEKEQHKITYRFNAFGRKIVIDGSDESALETLASRREKWEKDKEQAQKKLRGEAKNKMKSNSKLKPDKPEAKTSGVRSASHTGPSGLAAIDKEHLPTFFRS